MNEKIFINLLTEQHLVAQYLEGIEGECYDSITTEELEEAYANDPAEFQSVDIRLFGFEVADDEKADSADETTTASTEETTATEDTTVSEETTATEETTSAEETTVAEETTASEETTEKEEKVPTKTELLAQEMLERVNDEESFIELAYEYAADDDKETFKNDTATLAKNIKKSVVESQIGEDLAEWLYSSERSVGDKTVYTTDEYVYVIYIIKTAYRVEEPLVDARHILIGFDDVAAELKKDESNTINIEKKDDVEIETSTTETDVEITNEGTGYSIELVAETYKRANKIYEEYLKGAKTEESFATLADTHSSDKGSSGTANGGLYESIERGKMVTAFENWVYDENRNPGDVGLVMTEYGWHVMYFVKQHEEPAWMVSARTTLGSEAFAKIEEETEAAVANTASEALFFNYAGSEALKAAEKLYG